MTSEPALGTDVYVWAWLPGAADPVVAGVLTPTGQRHGGDDVLSFTYARSYRERADAISLFEPELPLADGTADPSCPLAGRSPWRGYPAASDRSAAALAGCLRDGAPDGWGRRVISAQLAGSPDTDLDERTYLLASGTDRTGALDFQASATRYVPRGDGEGTPYRVMDVADRVASGQPVPPELAEVAAQLTCVGGARPKARFRDGSQGFIAKLPVRPGHDDRPVEKAEAVAMMLAARAGVDVAYVEVLRIFGRDVLLVERFDRTPAGGRRMMVSALTVLGLREEESRYASYPDLARAMRHPGWADTASQLRELFTRMVVNIAVGNTDDHLRNHSAFWDGQTLVLTPAYDIAPQRRSTPVASHAIGLDSAGRRASQFWLARAAAPDFLLTEKAGQEIIDHVVDTIRTCWDDACDQARLTLGERAQLLGREILNPYVFWDQP